MAEFNATQLGDNIQNALNKALEQLADDAVDNIVTSISQPYPPASDPGSPPHTRTGDLIASISRSEVEDFSVTVGSDSPYALYLEHGTEKMSARPFMAPEVQVLESKIEQTIDDFLSEALK